MAAPPHPSVAQRLGTNEINVTEILKFHEHEDDEGRYMYFVTRRDERSRHRSSGFWVGTPDLSSSDDSMLFLIATTNGLVGRDIRNYDSLRAVEKLNLKSTHGSRYEPLEETGSRFMSRSRGRAVRKLAVMPYVQCTKREHCVRELNHSGHCKIRPSAGGAGGAGGESDSEDETPLSSRIACSRPTPAHPFRARTKVGVLRLPLDKGDCTSAVEMAVGVPGVERVHSSRSVEAAAILLQHSSTAGQ